MNRQMLSVSRYLSFALLLALASAATISVAQAQSCPPLPYPLANGQSADATQLMADLNAILNCINTGQFPSRVLTGPGGGDVTLQNLEATLDYNFNFPATAGSAGQLLTSGGGSAVSQTWTSTGTSGHALPFLDGSNTWSGVQIFGPVLGAVTTQTGTSYTLAATDCGTTIRFTNASPITLTTLNTLPTGCAIAVEQAGTGQITITNGPGAAQHSPHAYTKTFGQYAIVGLFVDNNSGGAAADFIITGDGA